jgi:hypothetical protein
MKGAMILTVGCQEVRYIPAQSAQVEEPPQVCWIKYPTGNDSDYWADITLYDQTHATNSYIRSKYGEK